MTAGHEERFRQLFAEEAAARLARLGEAALDLEGAAAADPAVVGAMLREAHSLKGGAAVVGLEPLGRAAHALEDVIERLRADVPTAPGLVDGLLRGIDGLRALLAAVHEGHEHAAGAEALVAELRALVGDPAGLVERATASVHGEPPSTGVSDREGAGRQPEPEAVRRADVGAGG